MQTIEFVPFEWENDDFNPEIDFIEVIGTRKGVSGRLQRVMRKLG